VRAWLRLCRAGTQTFAKFLFVFKAADGGEVPSISLALVGFSLSG